MNTRSRILAQGSVLGAFCAFSLFLSAPSSAAPSAAEERTDELERAPADPYWTPRLEESVGLRRIVSALRALRDPRAPDGQEVVDGLKTDALQQFEELFVILRDGQVPVLDEGAPQPLSERQLALVLGLFERMGRSIVLSELAVFLRNAGEARTNRAHARLAVRTIGAVGRASELSELLEHAGEDELPRSMEGALQQALLSVLQRDPEACDWLNRNHTDLEPNVLAAVLLAVGEAGDKRALPLLNTVAQTDPDFTVLCLSQIRALGPCESRDVNSLIRLSIRKHLESDQMMVRRAAMLALGRLYDAESLPQIADALDDPMRGTREDAATALRLATGLQLESTPAAWRAWLEIESDWFQETGLLRLETLRSGELEEMGEAVRELSQHLLNRLATAEALEALLRDQRPEARHLACTGLSQVGTPESAPALREALEDTDPDVRASAERALAVIAGS